MKPDQRLMRMAAEQQCIERSERDGVPTYVFVDRRDAERPTWYVVTDADPKPEGAELVYSWPLNRVQTT